MQVRAINCTKINVFSKLDMDPDGLRRVPKLGISRWFNNFKKLI